MMKYLLCFFLCFFLCAVPCFAEQHPTAAEIAETIVLQQGFKDRGKRQEDAIGALNGDIASCGLTNVVSVATWQADIAAIRPLVQKALFDYINPLTAQADAATGDAKTTLLLQIQNWNLFANVISDDAQAVAETFKP